MPSLIYLVSKKNIIDNRQKGLLVKRIFRFVFFVACFAMLGAHPSERILCRGFLPENDFSIPVGFTDGGLSLDQWASLLNKYEYIYYPMMALQYHVGLRPGCWFKADPVDQAAVVLKQ